LLKTVKVVLMRDGIARRQAARQGVYSAQLRRDRSVESRFKQIAAALFYHINCSPVAVALVVVVRIHHIVPVDLRESRIA